MRPGLVIGARHVVRYTVPVHQTVPDLLPALAEFRRGQPVFATGFMVGLMEAPCMAAVYPHLEPGEVTVGTLINMTHLSASPPGTSLVAEARAVAVDGRSVRFAVVVADAAGQIAATGEHGLRVVDAARFRDRLAAQKAQLSRPGSSPVPGTPTARTPAIAPLRGGQIVPTRAAPRRLSRHPAGSRSIHNTRRQAPNRSRPAPKECTMRALAEPGADAAGGVAATMGRPNGQALTVRTVTQADADGLDALFQGLSDDDRHHRFFSLRPPARTFLEQMTRAADEGGYRLVAVASGAEDALVAEAGYALLPDGDGEFALTVAAGWRGRRLGRYLLDAIVAAAAARRVPNLQADIMLGNTPMLALVRDRGYITLHRDEFSDIRIAIDAAQPARRRPRDASALPGAA